jgi:predicted O-methyltransferase YrrM
MKKLWLSEPMISDVFWKALRTSYYASRAQDEASLIANATGPLVDEFPSVAGSISKEGTKMLWLVTRYFSPKNVCEIGTYIGRSALAMAFGGLDNINQIYTCDGTFDCLDLEKLKKNFSDKEKINAIDKISYFGKTMSTDMLNTLKNKNIKIDFLFIDGRVSTQDCEILAQILSEDCIILLDDFEGVEKGVSNALLLRGLLKGHILLQPEYNEKIEYRGITAMMVPANLLTLSRQQGLPVNM